MKRRDRPLAPWFRALLIGNLVLAVLVALVATFAIMSVAGVSGQFDWVQLVVYVPVVLVVGAVVAAKLVWRRGRFEAAATIAAIIPLTALILSAAQLGFPIGFGR